MEMMCGTGYERKEYWGGTYSQLKRVEETHRPSNSIRNKRMLNEDDDTIIKVLYGLV